MGACATSVGDVLSCCKKHKNTTSVQGTIKGGRDLDEIALAAINQNIEDSQSGLVNTVRLSFLCINLPNLDTFTRSDSMAVLYRKSGSKWLQLGCTEVIMDCLQPQWIKQFDVPYNFEVREQYKVDVYDVDDFNNLLNLENHDYVGSLVFTLHEVVTQRDQTLERNLLNNKRPEGKSGVIKITGEERKKADAQELVMRPQARFASESGFNFFLVMKRVGLSVWKPVYKSEIKPFLNGAFQWNVVTLLTTDIAYEGDVQAQFRIEFFQSRKSGIHVLLGCVNMTIAEIQDGKREWFIIDKKGRTATQQTLTFSQLDLIKQFTFLDYVFGGCEISLSIAIDFTLSNGDPSHPNSLHNRDLNKNEYLHAIKSVGNILQYYDHKKQIPALGFGAAIPPRQNRAEHCFALNGNIFQPECDGIEGVINAYKNAISCVQLYGPTHFSQLLDFIIEMTNAEQVTQEQQKYKILLILTDGVINDLQNTIDQVVRASCLPLSIIIVGVGNADFSAMDQLDADTTPLYSQKFKKCMDADIVQFVPYRQFASNSMLLAMEVLQEVPTQFLNYFKTNGIRPNSATEAQKKQLQRQLSRLNSKNEQNEFEVPMQKFFKDKKEQFLQLLEKQGIDLFAAQDFIEQKGIYSLSVQQVIDHQLDEQYENPLRLVRMDQAISAWHSGNLNSPISSQRNQNSEPIPYGQPVMQPIVQYSSHPQDPIAGPNGMKLRSIRERI